MTKMPVPAAGLFWMIGGWLLTSVVLQLVDWYWPTAGIHKLLPYGPWLLVLLGWLALLDALWLLWRPWLGSFERQLPQTLAQGRWAKVRGQITAPAQAAPTFLRFCDQPPAGLLSRHRVTHQRLAAAQQLTFEYAVCPPQRGDLAWQPLQAWRRSRLGCWWQKMALPCTLGGNHTRVYPNFEVLQQLQQLSSRQRQGSLGIRQWLRAGGDGDFQQLREYQAGDELRQVDWKASSRLGYTVAREYNRERQQQLLIVLDTGPQWLDQEAEFGTFDDMLNGALMLSLAALQQGDSVAMACVGAEPRWLPPGKGRAHINHLLNGLYAVQPQDQVADYVAQADWLMQQTRQRCWVIWLSQWSLDEVDEIRQAWGLLRSQHQALFVNITPVALQRALTAPVDTSAAGLAYGAACDRLNQRHQALQQLAADGAQVMDLPTANMINALINRYASIRQRLP